MTRNVIRGWDFSEDQINSARFSSGVLLNPSIDLTSACNLNCYYCFNEDKSIKHRKRKRNELSLEEIKSIIKDFHELNAKTINIVGSGEPTIDYHFQEIIELINSYSITSVLFTNGIKIANDDTLVDFLYKNNVSVVLKMNSIDNYKQDLIAGKKGYSKIRDKALEKLMSYDFNKGISTRLGIDSTVFKGNLDELPVIHRFCRDNNIFPISANFIPTGRTLGGRIKEKLNPLVYDIIQPITNMDSMRLLNKNKEIDDKFGIKWATCLAYYNGGGCSQILGLYVDIEGNIWPCVAKSIRNESRNIFGLLGNIRKGDKIRDIWVRNDYIREIRMNYTGACLYKNQDLVIK